MGCENIKKLQEIQGLMESIVFDTDEMSTEQKACYCEQIASQVLILIGEV